MAEQFKDEKYELYCKEIIDQYDSEIDRCVEPNQPPSRESEAKEQQKERIEKERKEADEKKSKNINTIKNNIKETIDVIWSSRNIKPRDGIGNDDLIFETDLHGDMRAFL
ncbi:MAG: hypothetical protein LBB13_01395, partial [Rickettsiales bacterium]|nr:hypothetical protein [Rickettsiales bacterium]